MTENGIDRAALVSRHVIHLTEANPQNVVTVGNGNFGYTADITGMQTFTEFHDQMGAMRQGKVAVNTSTMTTWGWHEMPNPDGYVLSDAMSRYETSRGPVLYPDRYDMQAAMQGEITEENRAGAWLHVNPHRVDLGRIGLELRDQTDGEPLTDPTQLSDVEQTLDLWAGRVDSRFVFAGEPVSVTTVAAPDSDTVAFRITSALLQDGRARIVLRFPYASDGFFQTSDWSAGDRHRSQLRPTAAGFIIDRTLDSMTYHVHVAATAGTLTATEDPHFFELVTDEGEVELVVRFAPGASDVPTDMPSQPMVEAMSGEHWEKFWRSGAAIDFSESTDPRASELERRVVLSQYLTAVNCAGHTPPAETGLITNSWQGKFHLEMHFWHAAHFATWGRPALLERSLDWYLGILPQAQATAARQGYPGARWPKHVGPDGRESPDPIGSLLAWQQPHILYMLELVYRATEVEQQPGLVERFAYLVEETALFMAAFPEERDGVLHLGPPIMPAQEFYDARTTEDPTFELSYWWWGLELAQRWNERRGRARNADWTSVQERLARPQIVDGHYAAVAGDAEMRRDDHPSLLAALGVVPLTPLIDPTIMEATLLDVLDDWEWPTAWGWDFPVMAMTGARLGLPDLAIDALLRPAAKNEINGVGHNPQMGGILPLYLPGNGALLAAVSLLAAGADGVAPVLGGDGWNVVAEGFVAWP